MKQHCQAFQDDLNSNWIHLRDDKKIYLGIYTLGAWYVFIKQRKSKRESIANDEKLCYLSLPLANVQILRIEEFDLDPHWSDNEVKYVSLDEHIKTRVLAAQVNQPKPPQDLSKKPVQTKLRSCIEKNHIMLYQKP